MYPHLDNLQLCSFRFTFVLTVYSIQRIMRKELEQNDILDMDVLKHQVKIAPTHIKHYELPGFLMYAFKGNKLLQNQFLRMDEEFKEEYYQTVKFFEIDPSASHNPFYNKKYKELNNQLVNKIRQQQNNNVPKAQPITITQSDFSIFQKDANIKFQRQQGFQKGGQSKNNVVDENILISLNFDTYENDNFKRKVEDENNTLNPLKNQNLVNKFYPPIQHKFQMPGQGSASIFNIELEPNPNDLIEDDQFGETLKPTVQPMFKIKDSELLGKSIKMGQIFGKVQSIVNINDLIDISNVKVPDRKPKEDNLFIPLNGSIPNSRSNQFQFQDDFSKAQTQSSELQQPKANIFELRLDNEGNQEIQQQQAQQTKQDVDSKNQGSQNKVTTDKDSEIAQVPDEVKQEPKSSKELQDDIYKSIQLIQTQEVKYQDNQPQQVVQKVTDAQEIQTHEDRKPSVDIFQMEVEGEIKIERMELLPIQIRPLSIKKQDQQQNKVTENDSNSQNILNKPLKKSGTIQFPQGSAAKNKIPLEWLEHDNKKSSLGHPQMTRRQQPILVSIPEELKINTLPLWRQFYKKNKYQCQIQFYKQLKEELFRLQYFDRIQFIEQEVEVVKQIKRLSDQYSKCVEMDEEELLHAVIKSIQKKINSLNKNQTKLIAEMCISRDGKSLTAEIYQEIVSRKPQYADSLRRITKTIKIPQKKLEAFIVVAIISMFDNGAIFQRCKVYKQLIERLFKQFQQMKNHIEQIRQMSGQDAQEVIKSVKFQHYIGGIKKYYELAMRFFQVLRLVEGQNSYKFRLNKLRTELNTIYQLLNSSYKLSIPSLEQQSQVGYLNQYFNPYLQYLSTGNLNASIRLCGICFTPDETMIQRGGSIYHPECWNLIKKVVS